MNMTKQTQIIQNNKHNTTHKNTNKQQQTKTLKHTKQKSFKHN